MYTLRTIFFRRSGAQLDIPEKREDLASLRNNLIWSNSSNPASPRKVIIHFELSMEVYSNEHDVAVKHCTNKQYSFLKN